MIKALPGQMRYDVTEIMMEPGEDVKVIFENRDDMPHNLAFFRPGTDVAAVSNKQMEKPEEALKRDWLPEDPRPWAHSKLLKPKDKEELRFKAPEKPGIYPYVCTFPGHAVTMQGRLKILPPGPKLTNLKFTMYLGEFKLAPQFSKLKPFREGDLPDNLIEIKLDDYRNHFGVVYTGKLQVPKEGEYRFHIASDDGAKLFVDGKELIGAGPGHRSTKVNDARQKLTVGEHELRVEYFQEVDAAELFIAWEGEEFGLTPLSKWIHPAFHNGGRPPQDHSPPMPVVVGNTPVIYRNFINGAGVRGIGVGYPGKVSIAWNAEWMNLTMMWRGEFMNARWHWVDRGGIPQGPYGYEVVSPVGARLLPFAQLASTEAQWPVAKEGTPSADYKWRGYTLDEKRHPTFRYLWKGLEVSDYFEVVRGARDEDSRLLRIVRIDGRIPADASFLAASGDRVSSNGESFELTSHGMAMTVGVEGARIALNNLIVPAQREIRVTYAWAIDHAHHAHRP